MSEFTVTAYDTARGAWRVGNGKGRTFTVLVNDGVGVRVLGPLGTRSNTEGSGADALRAVLSAYPPVCDSGQREKITAALNGA